MKNCVKSFFIAAACATVLTSCSTVRKTAYLMDLECDVSYPAHPAPELILQSGDMIDIQVMSPEAELSAPFHVTAGEGKSSSDVYTVSNDGYVDFPVLGSIKVGGLSIKETERLIAGTISDRGLIRQPTVRVNLDNFTVTVIGQSGNSVLPVSGNSITILQAIAGTGGIRSNSDIKHIMVVRTKEGRRTAFELDLQSKALFESPAFYLQQNDIVYIKPRGTTLSPTGQTVLSVATAGLTLLSVISNFILWSSR